MRGSFRLRLALASALLAGLALAGFAAVALWQLRQAKIDALDLALRDQAERELSMPRPLGHWAQHAQHLARGLGAHKYTQTLLLAEIGGREVFRSAHWPVDLSTDSLPWPRYGGSALRPDLPPPPLSELDGRRLPPPPPPMPVQPVFVTVSLQVGGTVWRLGLAASPHGRLAVGVDLGLLAADVAVVRNAFLLALPVALGLIGLGAWLLSGQALAPIRRLTQAMAAVTAQGLDRRVSASGEDLEFQEMVEVFNRMLERLEQSFLQASRFSADAAHELKTPLAVLQGQVERAMAMAEEGSLLQQRLTSVLDEIQRLAMISRKLLLLSLADAGRLRLNLVPFNLSAALRDLLEDAQMLDPRLDVAGTVEPGLIVKADAELLKQVLHNLLSNAIKYNRPRGWLRIAAIRQGGRAEISIANACAGIAAVDRNRLFERFYRVDPSHSRQVEGVGLGLSLSREIIRAHGGELWLATSAPDEARFVLNLALASLG